jgi:hypothetical protein
VGHPAPRALIPERRQVNRAHGAIDHMSKPNIALRVEGIDTSRCGGRARTTRSRARSRMPERVRRDEGRYASRSERSQG